ncbi:hypothetical protein K502DRAFT_349567 [Neoconidiobolus thromboides FSU 785]|nr:hypothetical protein K502DRAFT_349567 [Neoconidiobolus thromboides FSU 785]
MFPNINLTSNNNIIVEHNGNMLERNNNISCNNVLMDNDLKERDLNYSNIPPQSQFVTNNYNCSSITGLTLLYTFDTLDLLFIQLFSSMNNGLILNYFNESEMEYFKQNRHQPIYNFILLKLLYTSLNLYLKPEHATKSILYLNHIVLFLEHYQRCIYKYELDSIQESYLNRVLLIPFVPYAYFE